MSIKGARSLSRPSDDLTGGGVVYAIQERACADTNCGPGGKGWRDDGCAYTLEARNKVQAIAVALRGREGGGTIELGDEVAGTLRASGGGGDKPHVLTVVHGTQDPCVQDDIAFALGRNNGGENVIGFSCKDYGADAINDLTPTMRAIGHGESHANAGGQLAVAVLPFNTTQITSPSNDANPQYGDPCHGLAAGNHPPAICVTGDLTHTLKAEGFDASEDGTGRGQPITPTPDMFVRRLMPVECERLQGFPPDWTLVPVGKKLAADGPRYKQLGNSWAVPCVSWIGRRIAAQLADLDRRKVDLRPVETIDGNLVWMLCP